MNANNWGERKGRLAGNYRQERVNYELLNYGTQVFIACSAKAGNAFKVIDEIVEREAGLKYRQMGYL